MAKCDSGYETHACMVLRISAVHFLVLASTAPNICEIDHLASRPSISSSISGKRV